MGKFNVIDEILEVTGADESFTNITVGEVVDTNDPQQMGRIRAICPSMGDIRSQALKHVPWAMYGSPFGGTNEQTARGRDGSKSNGPVSYGMWAIPKVGSQVLIMCIDGNPANRVWIGCIPGQFFPHTMPHGRYVDDAGPVTSTENPIEPLYGNQTTAFGSRSGFEFKTRGADNQVAGLNSEEIASRVEFSRVADSADQGYTKSNIAPDKQFAGQPNKDSNIYSLTTPGFHAIHMDDTPESCRMRLRTTGGTQIILDDTNERVYISTAEGKTWIEIDEKGVVDIFASETVSVRSKDVHLTADETIRLSGKNVHINATEEFRVTAGGDMNFSTNGALLTYSSGETRIESDDNIHFKTGSTLFMESSDDMNILSGGSLAISNSTTLDINSGLDMSVEAGGPITIDGGPTIDLNSGGTASSAFPADASEPTEAFLTGRVPEHEPWARVYMTLAADGDSGNSQIPEYGYDDAQVGRGSAARGINFNRNAKWSR